MDIEERNIREKDNRIRELEAENAALKAASQQGHPDPCTFGPLCPYCEIDRLRAKLDRAEAEIQEWKKIVLGIADIVKDEPDGR